VETQKLPDDVTLLNRSQEGAVYELVYELNIGHFCTL